MLKKSVIKRGDDEWWFSEIDGSSDISLSFTLSNKSKWQESFKLRNDRLFNKTTTSIDWESERYEPNCVQINLVTDFDNNPTIPFEKINEIITYFEQFDPESCFGELLISFFNSDIDLNPLIKTPRRLEIFSCPINNITIPKKNNLNCLTIKGDTKDDIIITIDINLEDCRSLTELLILGHYKFHDNVYNKFKKLRNLSKLYMLEENPHKFRKFHKLPHLEHCRKLCDVNIGSTYVPKSMRDMQHTNGLPENGRMFYQLCRSLRKDPIKRLVDISIAMWSLHLPVYIILWITDWLPHSDSFSASIIKAYHRSNIPEWKLTEYEKIQILASIIEYKPTSKI
jgi:hypothetical protein